VSQGKILNAFGRNFTAQKLINFFSDYSFNLVPYGRQSQPLFTQPIGQDGLLHMLRKQQYPLTSLQCHACQAHASVPHNGCAISYEWIQLHRVLDNFDAPSACGFTGPGYA